MMSSYVGENPVAEAGYLQGHVEIEFTPQVGGWWWWVYAIYVVVNVM